MTAEVTRGLQNVFLSDTHYCARKRVIATKTRSVGISAHYAAAHARDITCTTGLAKLFGAVLW